MTYNLRWKAEDSDSTTDEAVVYDYFDVTIQYGCTADTVVLTNSGAGRSTEFAYTIGDTSGTSNNFAKTTTHGHSTSDCPIQMDCEYYNLDSQSWETYTDAPMKTCTMAGGLTFELESTDANVGDYRPEREVSMRIVYTSTSSNLSDD